MKVLIELPDNWLDASLMDNLDWITRTVKQEVKAQIVKALVEQVDLPKLEFTAEEMRPLVAEKLRTYRPINKPIAESPMELTAEAIHYNKFVQDLWLFIDIELKKGDKRLTQVKEETHIDRGSGFTHSAESPCVCLDPDAKEDVL